MNAALVPELICSNLEASLKFYCGLLGFEILYDRPEECFAFLGLNGAELMLEQPTNHERLWPNVELSYPYGRGINLEIGVENATLLHQRAMAAGFPIFLALEERTYQRRTDAVHVRQFAVQDPDGYLVRLSQLVAVI